MRFGHPLGAFLLHEEDDFAPFRNKLATTSSIWFRPGLVRLVSSPHRGGCGNPPPSPRIPFTSSLSPGGWVLGPIPLAGFLPDHSDQYHFQHTPALAF